MEKREVHNESKKEVKPPKKRKRKPVAKKTYYKRTEKKEWPSPPNDMASYEL